MARWDEATAAAADRQQQEELAEAERQKEERGRINAQVNEAQTAQEAFNADERRRMAVAAELEAFLRSADGASAKRFLSQTGKHILLGYQHSGGGHGFAIVLNGQGLIGASEPHGTWAIYGNAQDKARRAAEQRTSEREVPALEAVRYFMMYNPASKKEPEGMVDWLKAEIDKLAQPYTNS